MNLKEWHSKSQKFKFSLSLDNCPDQETVKISGNIWEKSKSVLQMNLEKPCKFNENIVD